MKLFLSIPFLLAGCAVNEEPVVAQTPLEPKPEVKAMSGRVTFQGLDERTLARIRVIPESGVQTFEPTNKSYPQVDGFWWKGDPEQWFKIPDHGEAWVGERPEQFDGETILGDYAVYFRSDPLIGWANSMRGGVREPGWVRDQGATKCHVPYPWIDR